MGAAEPAETDEGIGHTEAAEGIDAVEPVEAGRTGSAGSEAPVWVPDAEELAALVPGPEMVTRLVGVDPDDLVDDAARLEVAAAWTRVASWAQGQAALAAAALAAFQPVITTDRGPQGGRRGRTVSVSVPELALRLAISRRSAQAMITLGRGMTGALAPVGDALLEGVIDQPRARAFAEALTETAMPIALDVQAAVLPRARWRTATQVTRDIAEALIAADPTEATTRHHRARQDRRVGHPRVLADGMAGIYAVLPAVDAAALDIALDAAARTARTTGDARTTDQLRADALATTAHHSLAAGHLTPLHTPTHPDTRSSGPDGGAGDRVDDTPDSDGTRDRDACDGRGTDRESGDGERHGDDTGDRHDGTGHGGTGHGGTSDGPNAGLAADHADADAHGGNDSNHPNGQTGQGADPRNTTSRETDDEEADDEAGANDPVASSSGTRCRLPRVPEGGFRLGRIGGRIPHLQVMVPMNVLIGHDDPAPDTECGYAKTPTTTRTGSGDPTPPPGNASPDATLSNQQPSPDLRNGDRDVPTDEPPDRTHPRVAILNGYGPISPDQARLIANDATWQRILTDPATGIVRDLGQRTYRPPQALADLIRARDRTCVRPGCTVPATGCDIDHTIPHHHGGPTAETNLGPLCTTDHILKTHGAYHVTQPSPGTFQFHLPTGNAYTRHPNGTTTHQRQRDPQPQPDTPPW